MTGHPDQTGPLLDVERAAKLNGQLAHAGVDWLRNARRSLDDVVREISQSPPTRLDVLAGCAVAAHIAVQRAIGELKGVADELAPFAAAAEDYLPVDAPPRVPDALEVGGSTA